MNPSCAWILSILVVLLCSAPSYGAPSAIDSLGPLPDSATLSRLLQADASTNSVSTIEDHSTHFILATTTEGPTIVAFERNETSANLIWEFSRPEFGDVFFNQIKLLDFNQDGFEDILVCVGDESTFFTYIFLYQKGQFEQVYTQKAPYPTVVDLDGNGRPELLVNVYSNSEKELPFWYQGLDQHHDVLNALYAKIAGDHRNWSYHTDYPWAALHLCFPIQIMEVQNGRFVDVTERHQKHLTERIQFLNSIKPHLPKRELDGFREVMKALEAYQR